MCSSCFCSTVTVVWFVNKFFVVDIKRCGKQTQKLAYPNQISSDAIDLRLSRTSTHLQCTKNMKSTQISIIFIFYFENLFSTPQLGIIFLTQVKKKNNKYMNQLPVVTEKNSNHLLQVSTYATDRFQLMSNLSIFDPIRHYTYVRKSQLHYNLAT